MADIQFVDANGPLPNYPLDNIPGNDAVSSWWQDVNNATYRGLVLAPAPRGGVLDDTPNLQAFVNAGGGFLGINKTYNINTTLSIDVRLGSLWGMGCVFACSLNAGVAVQIFSTAVFPEIQNASRGPGLSGVRAIGNNAVGSTGLLIGKVGAGFSQSSDITVANTSWFQFEKLHAFTDNSWRFRCVESRMEQCVVGGWMIYQPLGTANSGEAIAYDHCAFYDSTGQIFVNYGQWTLGNGCSIGRNITIHAANTATIHAPGIHIESQPDPGYLLIQLDNSANMCITGGDLVINGGTVFAKNPIFLNGADTQLTIIGMFIPLNLGTFGRFEQDTSKLRDWVVGTGRLFCSGIQTSGAATLAGIGNNVNFSKLCNRLSNGDAEYGNINNWTTTPFGTGGSTVTATVGAKLNGGFGFQLDSVATGGIVARQIVPCADAAGRVCVLSAVHRVVAGTGTSGQLILYFRDNAGATISSISQNWLSTDNVFTYGPIVAIAPQGTVTIQAEFNVQANAGVQQIFVDEVCLNIL